MITNGNRYQFIIDSFNCCYNETYHQPISDAYGLTKGSCGLILASYKLFQKTNDKIFENCLYCLVNKELNRNVKDLSFGSGLIGLCLTLEWIGIKDEALGNQQEDIETLLCNQLRKEIYQLNFDYYEGASGTLLYLVLHSKFTDIDLLIEEYIKVVILYIESDLKYRTIRVQNKPDNKGVNLGTPHGITGILLVLLKIFELNKKETLRTPIQTVCNYLLKQVNEIGEWRFPSAITIDGERIKSGVVWCYGDLMSGYAIYKAGILLNDSNFLDFGLSTLQNCLERIEKKNMINNLCLCHGYSSLHLILRKVFLLTNNLVFNEGYEKYKEATEYILGYNLNHLKDNQNIKEIFTPFLYNPSLFFGVPGCLVSLLHDDDDFSGWTNCLLL